VRTVRQESNLQPVLVTFHPHPRVLVTPRDVPLLLTTIEEKERSLPRYFDGTVLVLDFNRTLMNLTPEEFVRDILIEHIGAQQLIVGYDHALGKNRSGTIAELQRLGRVYDFAVEVVGPVLIDGQPVSSSRIRRAMTNNRYEEALRLLGHDYAIFGTVKKGIGLGKKIGYPTANIQYDPRKLLPTQGVYACWAEVGTRQFNGVMFIGRNHFNPVNHISVEANLFHFDRDIYDEEIIVYPLHFLRENRPYDSTEALVMQIEKDKERAIHFLERENQHVDGKRA
jgi:riboflavin kinase/FMN adenylyltransferase